MVAVNGIYKFVVIGTVAGQQHVHTLHFRSTAAGSSVGFSEDAWQQDLIDQWQSLARTSYRSQFLVADSPCIQYQVRKVCGGLPLPAGVDEAEAGGSIVGTAGVSGDPLAPWLANVVTWRTALAGRRYRGRSFFGGLSEGDVVGAVVGGARLTATTSYATVMKTNFMDPVETALNAKMFVYSKLQAAVAGTACQNAGADIRSYQVRTVLATMKSRKTGHGL